MELSLTHQLEIFLHDLGQKDLECLNIFLNKLLHFFIKRLNIFCDHGKIYAEFKLPLRMRTLMILFFYGSI
jgi:hypothetical protein